MIDIIIIYNCVKFNLKGEIMKNFMGFVTEHPYISAIIGFILLIVYFTMRANGRADEAEAPYHLKKQGFFKNTARKQEARSDRNTLLYMIIFAVIGFAVYNTAGKDSWRADNNGVIWVIAIIIISVVYYFVKKRKL